MDHTIKADKATRELFGRLIETYESLTVSVNGLREDLRGTEATPAPVQESPSTAGAPEHGSQPATSAAGEDTQSNGATSFTVEDVKTAVRAYQTGWGENWQPQGVTECKRLFRETTQTEDSAGVEGISKLSESQFGPIIETLAQHPPDPSMV